MTRIVPNVRDAQRLVTSPRSQAKGDPVPTIVLLTGAIIALQAAKALRSGQPVKFDQHAGVRDAALIGGFVLAATFIPSDLVVAALLVILVFDVVVDPTLLADVTSYLVSKINPAGGG